MQGLVYIQDIPLSYHLPSVGYVKVNRECTYINTLNYYCNLVLLEHN